MLIALLLSCALSAAPDVLSDFEIWNLTQQMGTEDPTERHQWIERFNGVDPRLMTARGFEVLGDLYSRDNAPLDAVAAYRMACTTSGGLSAWNVSKYGMQALNAGSPRDAADALRFFDAAGGNAEIDNLSELQNFAVAQFRGHQSTLVLDAAIQGLRDGTFRSRADARAVADAAIAHWNEAMAAGSMDLASAESHLVSLMSVLEAWENNKFTADFDPIGLARAGLELTALDPANSVGVGAIGGALQTASLRGDSRLLEIAELAAADAYPSVNHSVVANLSSAANRMMGSGTPDAMRLRKRLLELSVAAEERFHPDTFKTMSGWQESLLKLAQCAYELGDIATAKEAIRLLKTAPLEGYVLENLPGFEKFMASREGDEIDEALEPQPQPATAKAPDQLLVVPRAEAPVLTELPSEPPILTQRADGSAELAPVRAASITSREIGISIFAALALLAIAVAWFRLSKSATISP